MSARFLGVDMGGSGTRAHLLCDQGLPQEWQARGGNLTLDPEAALDVLTSIVSSARPDAVCMGLAGYRTAPAAVDRVRAEIQRRVTRVTLMTDADLALEAAFGPVGEGIVICAGTGSIAAVRIGGRTELVGGHGFLFGDAGSAYEIGRRWISEALSARDAGEHELEKQFERSTGSTLDDVVRRAYQDPADRRYIAGLAQYVASSDHPSARRIIDDAGRALLALANVAQARFGSLPVRFSGGVFAIRAVAAQLEVGAAATAVSVRPDVAAARMAARGAGAS